MVDPETINEALKEAREDNDIMERQIDRLTEEIERLKHELIDKNTQIILFIDTINKYDGWLKDEEARRKDAEDKLEKIKSILNPEDDMAGLYALFG